MVQLNVSETTRASSAARVNRDDLECVKSQMGFARRSPDENAPEVFWSPTEKNPPPMVGYDVTIRNARPIVNELSLDREGFVLVKHKTSCANERDPAIVTDKYLEEMVPFLKDYFHASWVVPKRVGTGVVVRSMEKVFSGVRNASGPGLAHIDYASIAAPLLAARDSQAQGIPLRSYSRLMIIHAWRVLSPPPHDLPLALCDRSSVLDTDIFEYDNINSVGESFRGCALHFNPNHRWYYFPDLSRDELILFKSYDSKEGCNAQGAHTGFDNRRAYPNARPRESIEARFFVYFA
ncbi:CmcJ/NvfI family oxidoreductase [Bradyrhizobium ivorense]|uniref:CmcJ/NvfI family oxidoreductase n=1 Tax=Bradyrhizobium ivorense TaxID=2511166 RepID=UPI001E3B6BF7|nr:CmcJ/NvfI family oxidoreductase [Bradyrhizobium ivorense]